MRVGVGVGVSPDNYLDTSWMNDVNWDQTRNYAVAGGAIGLATVGAYFAAPYLVQHVGAHAAFYGPFAALPYAAKTLTGWGAIGNEAIIEGRPFNEAVSAPERTTLDETAAEIAFLMYAGWVFEGALPVLGIQQGTSLSFFARGAYEIGGESVWDHVVHGTPWQDALLTNAIFFGGGELFQGIRRTDNITAGFQPTAPQIWVSNKRFPNPVDNAVDHWTRHANEFPEFTTFNEYLLGTHAFIQNPPIGTLRRTGSISGDTILYHPPTNTLAISTSKGVPITMYRPDPLSDRVQRDGSPLHHFLNRQ